MIDLILAQLFEAINAASFQHKRRDFDLHQR